MKVDSLHNPVTGLLTLKGHINIYRQCNKDSFHSIKKCMDVETADGEAGTVWPGSGYDNYDRTLFF